MVEMDTDGKLQSSQTYIFAVVGVRTVFVMGKNMEYLFNWRGNLFSAAAKEGLFANFVNKMTIF